MVCPDETGNGKLAGIVSFGHTACDYPGAFTKVSYYDDWIQEHIQMSD